MSSTVATGAADAARPWDAVLLDEQDPTSLVAIARDRRLVLEDRRGPEWVDLCWVDEVALALIDLAVARHEGIYLVYPAPAGQLAVLLAAQLLLQRFIRRQRPSSLGLVTADTTSATRTWEALRIATTRIPGAPDSRLPMSAGRTRGRVPRARPDLRGADRRTALPGLARGLPDRRPPRRSGDRRGRRTDDRGLLRSPRPCAETSGARGSVHLGLVRARLSRVGTASWRSAVTTPCRSRSHRTGWRPSRVESTSGSPSSAIPRPRLPSVASARISAYCARRSPTGRTVTSSEVCQWRGTTSRR